MRKLIFILLLFSPECRCQSISATGSWTPVVTPITEAGNDYGASPQSAANQTLMSIAMPSLLFGLLANHYTVTVRRADSGPNWDTAGLQLQVRRTGDGAGGGSGLFTVSDISGGMAYQQITTASLYFFEGNNYGPTPRINIPVQYQITGVSVLVPVANYSATVTYTLADD